MNKLFCIPHAGASASVYLKWQRYFYDIDIVPVEVSGRGTRSSEKRSETLTEECRRLCGFIKSCISPEDKFAVFGHSMGCFMAYETVKMLMNDNYYKSRLRHVFFSGNRAPHLNGTGEYCSHVYKLPEKDFIDHVIREGGTSYEIFENRILRDYFLPVLIEDYRLTEQYSVPEESCRKLECDISIMNGDEDRLSRYEIEQWGRYASEDHFFDIKYFHGGHFYMNDEPECVADYIKKCMTGKSDDFRMYG